MQELSDVTGIVLKCEPIGEYDRRVVILTTERGKISAFAKGARKQGNRLMASTNPFCFGKFKLFEGRSSYSINEAEISNYFEEMRVDFEKACYGMYFLEVMDYYTRENNDEKQMLKLLYQSLRALCSDSYDNRLVRSIFEIKSVILNGEYPGLGDRQYLDSTVYAAKYIEDSSIEKLYTFSVSEEVLKELTGIAEKVINVSVDRKFKSLEILADL